MSRLQPANLFIAILILTLRLTPVGAQGGPDIAFQPAPRPMPVAVMIEPGARLELHFSSLRQGGLALLRLSGAEISGARLEFLGMTRSFFHVENDAWYALLNVDMEASPGLRALTVTAQIADRQVRFQRVIRVEAAGFIKQEFQLPPDRAHLVDPAIEDAEFARLDVITEPVGPKPLWGAAGFGLPLDSETTSPFGAFRVLNDGVRTRHTGWDQRAPAGSPVHAMAAGYVVFAGELDLRGRSVIIDHGLGLYTVYAHLSQPGADMGDWVEAGQVIGLSGNTGRSSGPHLHWDVILDGKWVDGLALVALWLPA